MKGIAALSFSALALLPLSSLARNEALTCSASHFVAAGGAEMRSTVVGFRNADLANPATIERLTIRNAHGQIVHDSGPATGTPHPLSLSFPGGLDITTVPPGATYFITTRDLWGLFEVPGSAGPSQGFSMSVTVEYSKPGKAELLSVSTRVRGRERLTSPEGLVSERMEHSSTPGTCVGVKPTF